MDSCYNFDIGKKRPSVRNLHFSLETVIKVLNQEFVLFFLSTKKIEFILQPLFIKSNYHGKERIKSVGRDLSKEDSRHRYVTASITTLS